MTRERLTSDIRLLIDLVQRRQLPFLAAAIAYYAFLSVIPLLIVGITVATTVAGQALATELIASLDEFLTPEAAELVEETIVDGAGRGGMTAVGLLVLLWGSLRVFRGLDIAFSQIYGVVEPKPLPEQLRDGLLVFGGIGVAIGATAGLSAVLSLVDLPFAGIAGTVGLLVVLAVIFLPMYYVFPGRNVGIREAVPGAIFASVGWTALGAVFGIYAANAGSFQLYGVLAGVLLLLVWFYFGGLIILLGAAINVVLGNRIGDRQLQQGGLRGKSQRASMTEASGPTDDPDDDAPADEPTDREPPESGVDSVTDDSASGTTQGDAATDDEPVPTGRQDPDVSARLTQEDIDELRRELDEMEERLEERTVHRKEIERDLKKYVRGRMRRGHATGWGPYLVLLYGTVMTLGAFFLLSSGWAVLAMLIIWLSTLGLYTLMLIVGVTIKGVRTPGRILEKIRSLR